MLYQKLTANNLGLCMNRKLVTILLAVAICTLTVISVDVSAVQAATNVSGIISSDTTWIQAGGPYTLTGNLLVENGVKLTIMQGVVVNLNNYYIMVNGTLEAIGSETNQITFNGYQITFSQYCDGWKENVSTGCKIQNAVLNCNLILNNAVQLRNSLFSKYVTVQVASDATTIITNNTFLSSLSINNGAMNVTNNTIRGQLWFLFNMVDQRGPIIIADNTISGSDSGLNVKIWDFHTESMTAIVQGNLIVNNTRGLNLDVAGYPLVPIIRNNTITNNTIGVSIVSYYSTLPPLNQALIYNNIYGNILNAKNEVVNNFEASPNWWGTINTSAISQTIYDYYDDFSVGKFVFSPILTAPNTKAPTYIIASASVGGSISPSGITRLNYGDSQTVSITANTGYHVLDVAVNGTSVGNVTSVSLQNIQGPTTITATFSDVIPETPSAAILAIVLTIATAATLLYLKMPNISKRTVKRGLI
jgi:hypothetical protein